eukprot:5681256-Ditylum_brightwellii.AAC.1
MEDSSGNVVLNEEVSEGSKQLENNNGSDFSTIDVQEHASADVANIERLVNEDDIDNLNSQVDRDIFVLHHWVHSSHDVIVNKSSWWEKLPLHGLKHSNEGTRSSKSLTASSSTLLLPLVKINSVVETSFQNLDACLLEAKNKTAHDEDGATDGDERVQAIIDRVAQIPSLMKTILLIDKNIDRKRILSYKIAKRIMLSPFSVLPDTQLPDTKNSTILSQAKTRDLLSSGEEEEDYLPESLSQKGPSNKSWLVRMIETEYKPIKQRAVDYLELLSDLTVLDYILDED